MINGKQKEFLERKYKNTARKLAENGINPKIYTYVQQPPPKIEIHQKEKVPILTK